MKKTKTAPKKKLYYYKLWEGKKFSFVLVNLLGRKMESGEIKFLIKLPNGELKEIWDWELYIGE
ncbi:MAG: hypothetical protein PHW73_15220 [Atribacterota bacterium]|nr:hypothetical protein [Atribacterota bacterium]